MHLISLRTHCACTDHGRIKHYRSGRGIYYMKAEQASHLFLMQSISHWIGKNNFTGTVFSKFPDDDLFKAFPGVIYL